MLHYLCIYSNLWNKHFNISAYLKIFIALTISIYIYILFCLSTTFNGIPQVFCPWIIQGWNSFLYFASWICHRKRQIINVCFQLCSKYFIFCLDIALCVKVALLCVPPPLPLGGMLTLCPVVFFVVAAPGYLSSPWRLPGKLQWQWSRRPRAGG